MQTQSKSPEKYLYIVRRDSGFCLYEPCQGLGMCTQVGLALQRLNRKQMVLHHKDREEERMRKQENEPIMAISGPGSTTRM